MLRLNLRQLLQMRDASVAALLQRLPCYANLIDSNARLQTERDLFQAQRDNLQEQKEKLVEARDRLRAQHDSLAEQKLTLVEERDRSQAQRDSLEEQKTKLLEERNGLRAQRDSLEEQKADLVEARDLLRTQRDSLEEQKSTLIEASDLLRAQRGSLEEQKCILVEQRDRARAERDSLDQQKDGLVDERDRLRAQRDSLSEQLTTLVKKRENIYHKPGHFYSPIPDLDDVLSRRDTVFGLSKGEIDGVDLRDSAQLALLSQLGIYAASFPYAGERPAGDKYYRNDNRAFLHIDAVTLFAMLQFARPRNLIEVGCGFSSALIYDTNRDFLGGTTDCAFIEPYPDTLKTVFGNELNSLTLLQKKVQEVPVDFFRRLSRNDVLFIDSTHVCKVGSDVDYLFKDVIPSLRPGVIVHVHDIFFPFEYPEAWVREGRAWNEGYVLRSFLQYNADFEILLWPSWMIHRHRAKWLAAIPGDLHTRPGELAPTGSIWLRRRLADDGQSA